MQQPMWYGSFFVGTDARVWPNTLKTCLRLFSMTMQHKVISKWSYFYLTFSSSLRLTLPRTLKDRVAPCQILSNYSLKCMVSPASSSSVVLLCSSTHRNLFCICSEQNYHKYFWSKVTTVLQFLHKCWAYNFYLWQHITWTTYRSCTDF